MAQRHPLSQKQIEGLRKSPHVRFVNAYILSFTGEFKEHVYNERQRGVPFREILIGAGIDPDLMDSRRIRNLSSSIHGQGKRGTGFSDILQKKPLPDDKKAAKTTEEKVARLQHELAFVKQEVEYLKKIYLADREVQQGCDSKHRRKSNFKSSET